MSPEIKALENTYKEYINNHRQNVHKAWSVIKANSDCMNIIAKNLHTSIDSTIRLIDMLVDAHDLSKYDSEEFDSYRKNFYPVSPEEKEANKEAFEVAWKHHYYNNLHHWNWWYETGNMDNMKMPYVVEMICDWEAMGYQFGNNSKQFYEQNKHKIFLGEKQRLLAEELMNIICN